METIRNYLESMFAGLPATAEVLRAKQELGAMMEDKYSELIAEGKSENEAVGTVISEFGNLEELAQELGLDEIMRSTPADNRSFLSSEKAKEYRRMMEHTAVMIGIGVFLCIICPLGCVIGGCLESRTWISIGVAMLFICIAVGVGLFIFAGITRGKWNAVTRKRYRLDYGTSTEIRNDWERARTGYTLLVVIGVICLIVSVVPVSIIGVMFGDSMLHVAFGTALMLVLIGIGVLLLVAAGGRKGAYHTLLRLNDAGSAGGRAAGSTAGVDAWTEEEFRQEEETVEYKSPALAAFMSVYWPTITAVYLITSFLIWGWGITWLIWPVAGIAAVIIRKTFGEERRYVQ